MEILNHCKTIPFSEYLSHSGINSHKLFPYLHSPLHAQAESSPPTPAQHLGTLVHARLADPTIYLVPIPAKAQGATKSAKLAFCEWANDRLGRSDTPPTNWPELCRYTTQLGHRLWRDNPNYGTAAELETVDAICTQIAVHPLAQEILLGAHWEQSLFAEDPDTGLSCKCRIDALQTSPIGIIDIKVLSDVSNSAVARATQQFHFIHQLAFYAHLIELLIEATPECTLLTIESVPPHAIRIFSIPKYRIAYAKDQMRDVLMQYLSCRRRGFFPGPDWNWTTDRYEIQELPEW